MAALDLSELVAWRDRAITWHNHVNGGKKG